MAAKPRGSPATALAGIDVEELAGDGDDPLLQRRPEETHPVVQRRREPREIPPDVEGSLRRARNPDAEGLEPVQQPLTLGAEGIVNRPQLALHELKAIHDAFRPKRERLLRGLEALGIRVDRAPEGTFYVWGDLAGLPPPLNDGMGLFRAALEQRVITVPGEFFDINPGKRRRGRHSRFRGHARFSFGPPMDVVERAVERLGDVVRARAA